MDGLMAETNSSDGKVVLGVDVGGTKILAALVKPTGKILARERRSTPRRGKGEATLGAIADLIDKLLSKTGTRSREIRAIGLAVPGVVDSDAGRVVVTPNLNLSGVQMVEPLENRFGVGVSLGNDASVGTLGEKWLGAARYADSAVGIFIGTGIGGGIIVDGRIVPGARGAAGEIGHVTMQIDGPVCGCGAKGCFEALASRTAIERDLRAAMARGRKTSLTDEIGKGDRIRSGALKRALKAGDKLTTEVMTRAAEVYALACLSVRHLLDPDVIVLGGGVIEACAFFLMPIIERGMAGDPLETPGSSGMPVAAALGDDSVILGAVALALQELGECPFESLAQRTVAYPELRDAAPGTITVGDETYDSDVIVRANGKVKRRRDVLEKINGHKPGKPLPKRITPEELRKACKGDPQVLIVGTGFGRNVELDNDAADFLRKRSIAFETLSTPDAVHTYNETRGRKAALIRVEPPAG